MPAFKDLSGKRYGRLTVIEPYGRNKHGKAMFLCKCDCGNDFITLGNGLQCGRTLSCGCLHLEKSIEKVKALAKHNMSHTRVYNIWHTMIQRCYYSKHKSYDSYGGRGITVCDEWRGEHGAENFIEWALSNGYRDDLTLDRIDPNGNYEPSNCRWATRKEQANNTRKNHFLTFDGKTQTVAQWADEKGLTYSTLCHRLENGWTVEKALTMPKRVKYGYSRSKEKPK